MDKQRLWDELVNSGVVKLSGQHVVLSSGEHTDAYANFIASKVDLVLRTAIVDALYRELTTYYLHPANIALISIGCGYWYAAMLANRFPDMPAAVLASKTPQGQYRLTRDQASVLKDRQAFIVDDVHTTGASLHGLAGLIRGAGGMPAGALYIVDRNKEPERYITAGQTLIPVRSIFAKYMPTWPNRDACPLCDKGVHFPTDHGGGEDEMHILGQPVPKD